jgi:hypothetical protein
MHFHPLLQCRVHLPDLVQSQTREHDKVYELVRSLHYTGAMVDETFCVREKVFRLVDGVMMAELVPGGLDPHIGAELEWILDNDGGVVLPNEVPEGIFVNSSRNFHRKSMQSDKSAVSMLLDRPLGRTWSLKSYREARSLSSALKKASAKNCSSLLHLHCLMIVASGSRLLTSTITLSIFGR